jgi:hypothetical protein
MIDVVDTTIRPLHGPIDRLADPPKVRPKKLTKAQKAELYEEPPMLDFVGQGPFGSLLAIVDGIVYYNTPPHRYPDSLEND